MVTDDGAVDCRLRHDRERAHRNNGARRLHTVMEKLLDEIRSGPTLSRSA
jgi:ATP-dependent protease HslVU (ClpYQ) ATPase subunit